MKKVILATLVCLRLPSWAAAEKLTDPASRAGAFIIVSITSRRVWPT